MGYDEMVGGTMRTVSSIIFILAAMLTYLIVGICQVLICLAIPLLIIAMLIVVSL